MTIHDSHKGASISDERPRICCNHCVVFLFFAFSFCFNHCSSSFVSPPPPSWHLLPAVERSAPPRGGLPPGPRSRRESPSPAAAFTLFPSTCCRFLHLFIGGPSPCPTVLPLPSLFFSCRESRLQRRRRVRDIVIGASFSPQPSLYFSWLVSFHQSVAREKRRSLD